MSEDTPKYANAATDADVQQLINTAQSLASAGAMNLTLKNQSGDTTLYGEFRITNKNPFEKYAQLSIVSAHVLIPLIKLGLGTVSGLKLEVPEGKENKQLLERMDEWAQFVSLRNKVQNITRCVVRDGTVITSLGREKLEKPEDAEYDLPKGGITAIDIMPMQHMTLLTESEKPNDTNTDHLLKGAPNRAILHEEKKTAEKGMVIFEREEFALFTLFAEGTMFKDIVERNTYGIYGISLLESIDRSLKDLMDLNGGFGAFMRRYGIDRLVINIPLVEQLRQEGRYDEAAKILTESIASIQKLKANEDIISGGSDVSSVTSGQVPSVKEMKESYECDVALGLLQSPLTMGKGAGTTYASGYLIESDRMIILEALQKLLLETIQMDIINPQLIAMGAKVGDIVITANDLTDPLINAADLLDARMNGDITEGEYRIALGYPAKKPEE